MANIAICGAQWGDEGKGKVVDIFAPHFDYVIRYQGGHNAGHSVVFNGERFALHVLPSGVFNPQTTNVIGNGVVVEPMQLMKEIDGMNNRGVSVSPKNLKISDRAHLILPYHGVLDRFRDSSPGATKIGTTGRGIGPTYEWKAGRRGIRFCDLKHADHLKKQIDTELHTIHQRYSDIPELAEMTTASILEKLGPTLDKLKDYVVDSVSLLAKARQEGCSLLYEGAQATLLDVDFGTYPFVTSSNSCATGISAGSGTPPSSVQGVVGICKAYATRVGEGPFPTELEDETGKALRDAGHEYGTTTGRPRRCGWLDIVALRYAHYLNGFTMIAIMKLDVLDGLDELKICTSYTINGEETTDFPASINDLSAVTPNYVTLPGWKQSLADTRRKEDLPQAALDYIAFIEKEIGCPVGLISVGPDREQTIKVKDHYPIPE